jgi:hypothetical protein
VTLPWAPRPTPTMIDIGVANPSAHGQAMISTVTAALERMEKIDTLPVELFFCRVTPVSACFSFGNLRQIAAEHGLQRDAAAAAFGHRRSPARAKATALFWTGWRL